jgi:hypothetical protein
MLTATVLRTGEAWVAIKVYLYPVKILVINDI